MPLTEFQQEYLRNCSHRWNVKTGATRSGKTYLDCAVTIPKRICAARGEGLLVMLGNTLGTLERNVLEPMRGLWGPELVGVVRTSASGNIVQLFGRKVYVLGADNKKHIARIQGAAFEYAYGDEITTWDEGVFQMLKSRLSCPHSHFDGTCNPESPSHWFKKFLDSDADIYCQAYTIDDNPTLPAQFVADLKKEYAGTVYYNRFILGQWMAANGVIYRLLADSLAAGDGRFFWPAEKQLHPWRIRIGVDFGGNGSKHAFVATAILPGWCGGAGVPSHRPGGAGCRLSGRQAHRVLHRGLCPVWGDPVHLLRFRRADPDKPYSFPPAPLQALLAGRPGGEQCQDKDHRPHPAHLHPDGRRTVLAHARGFYPAGCPCYRSLQRQTSRRR